MEIVRNAKLKIGVDPLGGASVAYWQPIVEMYGVEVEVVNKAFAGATTCGAFRRRRKRSSATRWQEWRHEGKNVHE